MSDIDTLTARRLEFVRTLESGTYRQGCGNLFDATFEEEDGRYSETDAVYCCLGVGRDVIEPGYFFTGEWLRGSHDDDYRTVRENFDMSSGETDRLIDMNDSRHRDFPFIARFLRKVWGLTGA